jgi:hypothetical protein
MFLTMWICLLGYGRGSIVSAGCLIVCSTLYSLKSLTNAGKKSRVLFFVLAFGLVVFIALPGVQKYLEDKTKLGQGFEDFSRNAMIKDYLLLLVSDPISMLIGADYYGTTIDSVGQGNPHNSFIRAHHIFGLPYFIAGLFLFFFTCRFDLRFITSCGTVFIAIMLFRGFTEPILLPTMLDIFLISLSIIGYSQRAPCKTVLSS